MTRNLHLFQTCTYPLFRANPVPPFPAGSGATLNTVLVIVGPGTRLQMRPLADLDPGIEQVGFFYSCRMFCCLLA